LSKFSSQKIIFHVYTVVESLMDDSKRKVIWLFGYSKLVRLKWLEN